MNKCLKRKKKNSCNDILSLQDTFVIPEGGNLFHTQQSSSSQQQQQVDKYETGHRGGTVNKRQTLKLITFTRGLFKKPVDAGIKKRRSAFCLFVVQEAMKQLCPDGSSMNFSERGYRGQLEQTGHRSVYLRRVL